MDEHLPLGPSSPSVQHFDFAGVHVAGVESSQPKDLFEVVGAEVVQLFGGADGFAVAVLQDRCCVHLHTVDTPR